MRILHVIPSVDSVDGGPSVAIRAMAGEAAALGADVTVATTVPGEPGRSVTSPVERWEREAKYLCFARTPGSWKFSWPLTRWLRNSIGDFDVVHVHALFSYSTLPACRLAERRGVPVVLRPLGTLDAWSMRRRAWKKWPYFTLLERRHLRKAAAIHVTSESEAAAVRRLGFGDRVRVIPLGVETTQVSRERSEGGRPFRVLFLSRLHPKKGLPLLFRAMQQLRDRQQMPIRLTVAGTGDPDYVGKLHRLAQEMELTGLVSFVGHLEGAEKMRALESSDCFVLPSYQENFGIAVAEAMAAGLPVVVSDQVALASVVGDWEAGLVTPCRADAISHALEQLAGDRAASTRMGENGASFVRDHLSWSSTAQALLDLYQELIETRGAVR